MAQSREALSRVGASVTPNSNLQMGFAHSLALVCEGVCGNLWKSMITLGPGEITARAVMAMVVSGTNMDLLLCMQSMHIRCI